MGLLDIINGMQQGPHGAPPQDGSASSGGMSPMTIALLGLLAYKAVQHFGNQPGQQTSTPANPGAGGLGGLLGGLFGGGPGGATAGRTLNELIPGGLGASAGGLLTGGLGRLLQDFQNSGKGSVMQSWMGSGPNQPIAPRDLESAIGNDALDALAKRTGMDREELLSHLSHALPGLVDQLTPKGRLPSQEEASRMMEGGAK